MNYIKLSKKSILALNTISAEIWSICTKEEGSITDINLATELLKQISYQIDHIVMYIESKED